MGIISLRSNHIQVDDKDLGGNGTLGLADGSRRDGPRSLLDGNSTPAEKIPLEKGGKKETRGKGR